MIRSLALAAIVLAGCASAQTGTTAQPDIAFLDLPTFDDKLAASMSAPLPKVDVTFHDSVKPSNLPPRLQRWLQAVDSQGGKVTVTPPPAPQSSVAAKSPFLIIGAISTLWSGAGTAREMMQAAALRSAGKYDAELVLRQDGVDVSVARVVFRKRTP